MDLSKFKPELDISFIVKNLKSFDLKISFSKSIALLVWVTFFDHFFGAAFLAFFLDADFFTAPFFALDDDAFAINLFLKTTQS